MSRVASLAARSTTHQSPIDPGKHDFAVPLQERALGFLTDSNSTAPPNLADVRVTIAEFERLLAPLIANPQNEPNGVVKTAPRMESRWGRLRPLTSKINVQ
jgi:hypothetical protein